MDALTYITDTWHVSPNGHSPIEVPNTDRWHSFVQMIRDLDLRTGAEIGTERGLFAKRIARLNPQLKLYCIDPWTAYRGYREHVTQSKLDNFYDIAKERLAPYDCKLIRKFSVEASSEFKDGSLDFCYIDGNHSLLHVVQDLWHWVPKVRKGGIVAGHDFIRRVNKNYYMHVIEAVTAYTNAYEIKPWYVLGRKDVVEGELRDKPRSYLWVKE